MGWGGVRSLVGSVSAVMLTLGLGCSPSPAPEPSFSREEAMRKASAAASRSAPEISPAVVRIDRITAELTTLGETDRQRGLQRSSGYGAGRDQNTPVWSVSVEGYFQFQGMPDPRAGGAGSLYEAEERVFIYDARTGEAIGSQIPHSRPVATTPVPAPANALPP